MQESMQAQVAEAATEHAPAASSSQRYSSLQDLTGQCLRDRSSDTSSRHSTSALNAPKAQVPRRPRPGQSLGVSLPESRYAATTQETRQTSVYTLRQPEPREDLSASRSPRRPGIHAHTHTNTHTQIHTETNTQSQTEIHTQSHTHRHTDTNRVPHKHAQTHTPQLERHTGKNKRALPHVPAPKKPTWLHRRAKPLRPRSHCGQECSCGPWSRQGSSAATKHQAPESCPRTPSPAPAAR